MKVKRASGLGDSDPAPDWLWGTARRGRASWPVGEQPPSHTGGLCGAVALGRLWALRGRRWRVPRRCWPSQAPATMCTWPLRRNLGGGLRRAFCVPTRDTGGSCASLGVGGLVLPSFKGSISSLDHFFVISRPGYSWRSQPGHY